MAETRDLSSVLNSAAHAAEAHDFDAAEAFLREATGLQEARLGPLHPDLATTLNNLAVVCEITDKPAEAEAYYRRAYAIATATHAADHPFVATSRKNLIDFCEARGIPVEAAPAEPPPTSAAPDAPTPESTASPESPAPDGPQRATIPDRQILERALRAEPRPALRVQSRALAAGAVSVAIVAVVLFFLTRERPPASEPVSASEAGTGQRATPELPAEPRLPAPKPAAAERTGRSGAAPSGSFSASPQPAPAVMDARLCRTLATGGSGRGYTEWRCESPGSDVAPGPLVFYTRVASARDATIHHRWYRGDELRQSSVLRIRANLSGGYRTYSRHTVDRGGSGAWRVELRTAGGTLLHQKTFVVR